MEVGKQSALPECCHPSDIVQHVLGATGRHGHCRTPQERGWWSGRGCSEGLPALLQDSRYTVTLSLGLETKVEATVVDRDDLQGCGLHAIYPAEDVQHIVVGHARHRLRRKVGVGLEVDRLVGDLQHSPHLQQWLDAPHPKPPRKKCALPMAKSADVKLDMRSDLLHDTAHDSLRFSDTEGSSLPQTSNKSQIVVRTGIVDVEVHLDLRAQDGEGCHYPRLRPRLRSHLHQLLALDEETHLAPVHVPDALHMPVGELEDGGAHVIGLEEERLGTNAQAALALRGAAAPD
mmetsp:Transcript_60126/g.188804  ORF Transcript_60126/g.188804 Transcript_60126/m.188804 type:complete len:289 (-) Transcript_60126:195-1061(-)